MIKGLVINERDNVGVAIEKITAGEEIKIALSNGSIQTLLVMDDVPIYHKMSISSINRDDFIVKYGEHIGKAKTLIEKGKHVHEHNTENIREDLYV